MNSMKNFLKKILTQQPNLKYKRIHFSIKLSFNYHLTYIQIEKEKLRKYTNNIFEYECKYDGLDESTGRKRVKLSGFNEFEDKALKFFINSIQNFYPNLKQRQNQTNENGELNIENENEKDQIG